MTVPASVSVSLTPVLIAKYEKSFTISLQVTGDRKNADKKLTITTLIDSGAQGKFLDKKLALKENWALTKLKQPIIVRNVDGTKNRAGLIEYSTWMNLKVGNKDMKTRFLVTDLGKEQMILGLPWLKEYNPKINWATGTIDIDSIKIV